MFKELFPFSTPSCIIVLILITVGVELLQLKTEMILHKLTPIQILGKVNVIANRPLAHPYHTVSYPVLSYPIPFSLHTCMHAHMYERVNL